MTPLFEERVDPFFPHLEIVYVEVDPIAKTGTALRAGYTSVTDAEYLLITNGDTYIPDIDVIEYLEYHKANKSDWTFILKYIHTNVEKFGNVTIHGNHVEEFIEKPSSPDMYRYLTNCGWYMVSHEFYQNLAYQGDYIEVDLFPSLPKS